MSRQNIPHSWPIERWPDGVFPNEPAAGRYLVRTNRDALQQAGAICRVGRQLVVLGDRYERWLQRKSADVTGYPCPANHSRQAAAVDSNS